MDKELAIMEEIHGNSNISQREVSNKTGISLGNVNIIIKKMIKEGLIKMEQIPASRVVYMLTPKGMLEKANKTYSYITKNYSYIEEQKNLMKIKLEKVVEEYGSIQVLLYHDNVSEILKLAIDNLQDEHKEKVILIKDTEIEKLKKDKLIVAVKDENYLNGYKVLNLLNVV